jgi:molecular chaperone GrpE (heat shock protein)
MTDGKQLYCSDAEIDAARKFVAERRETAAGFKIAEWTEPMLSTLDRALDALARERQEDTEDAEAARASLADPSPSIPYEQVRRELGLDDKAGDALDRTAVRQWQLQTRIADLEAQVAQLDADGREYCKSTDACMASAIETSDAQSDRIAALKARERRVREACEDTNRQCAQAQYDPEVASVAGLANDILAILDGKVTPAEAPPTITLDALKMGIVAEEVAEQCPRCHGSGRRLVDLDEAACPRCYGTGRV